MQPLKPALTYAEQVNHLSDYHNLHIDDYKKAEEILSKVNYYRLSAYGLGLKQKADPEKYIDGITLQHIYRLYQFDSLFRNALMHIIEHIEIRLRTQIANYLALKYGPEGYADPANFISRITKKQKTAHELLMDSFKEECERQKNTPIVRHHEDKYGGHYPIWVAIELFSFGNLSSLYSIMQDEDKKAIARLYNTNQDYLGSWILSLVEIRNICAHYSRVYNMPLKQAPYLYREHRQYRTGRINKVFPVILVIKRMLSKDLLWKSFEEKLESLIDEYQDVLKLSFMNFPAEWRSVLRS